MEDEVFRNGGAVADKIRETGAGGTAVWGLRESNCKLESGELESVQAESRVGEVVERVER